MSNTVTMSNSSDLSQESLKKVIRYEPETGLFYRISKRGTEKLTGTYDHSTGYIRIKVYKKLYAAHRLAFLYMNGAFPPADTDHINRVRSDNRFLNLRECSHAQNSYNRSMSKRNKTGYRGVSRVPNSTKFRVCLAVEGKINYLGLYDDAEEASLVYDKKAKEVYKDFYQPTTIDIRVE